MTLPGADTMKAGINGLESFRLELGRRSIGWRVVESIASLRDSVGVLGGITVWPLVSFALLPFVYGSSGAMTEGIIGRKENCYDLVGRNGSTGFNLALYDR